MVASRRIWRPRGAGPGALRILRPQTRVLGDAAQNLGAQLVVIVKGEFIMGQPSRARSLCEPLCRFTRQPMRSTAASTRRALVAGHLLTQHLKREFEG